MRPSSTASVSLAISSSLRAALLDRRRAIGRVFHALACCDGNRSPRSHIAYFLASNRADRAMPDSRPRCGSPKTSATPSRTRRGPDRMCRQCRWFALPVRCRGRSRTAIVIARRLRDCRRTLRWCRHGPRRIDIPAVLAFRVAAAGQLGHGALKRGRPDIGKPLQMVVDGALGTTSVPDPDSVSQTLASGHQHFQF